MKRYIKESESVKEFTVEVTFSGLTGASECYTEYADDADDAVFKALDDAADDLEVTDVTDNGDGTYDVNVRFAGYIGIDNSYVVSADDEDEASDLALEEAREDLEGEVISDEYDD